MKKETQKTVVEWAGQARSPDVLLIELSRAFARTTAAYCAGDSVDEGMADMQIALWRLADAVGFQLDEETSFRMFLHRNGRE